MRGIRAMFLFAVFIDGCVPLAIIEPVKPSAPPAPPSGPLVVNCSTRLLRGKSNPSLVADANRFYPSSKFGSSSVDGKTGSETERAEYRGIDPQQISERDRLLNCSDPEISIEPIREHHEWKNVVVMGCTLAVALEILIVLFMVVFWQQIRWTLRKINCPCDVLRRQSRRHRAMRRREETGDDAANQETNMDDAVSLDSRSSADEDGPQRGEASRWGTEMQIYEPTTSGALNDSFILRSEDDTSSLEDERPPNRGGTRRDCRPCRTNNAGDTDKGHYSEIDNNRGISAYDEADCFAPHTSYVSNTYDRADGGETSEGCLYDTDDYDHSQAYADNLRAEGGPSSMGWNGKNGEGSESLTVHGGSKKGKESARSHRKGLQRPVLVDAKADVTDEIVKL